MCVCVCIFHGSPTESLCLCEWWACLACLLLYISMWEALISILCCKLVGKRVDIIHIYLHNILQPCKNTEIRELKDWVDCIITEIIWLVNCTYQIIKLVCYYTNFIVRMTFNFIYSFCVCVCVCVTKAGLTLQELWADLCLIYSSRKSEKKSCPLAWSVTRGVSRSWKQGL